MKKSRAQPLIDRSIDDENFAHTVSMMGSLAAYAETVTEGQKLSWNDRNMIQLPVEIALAFMRQHLSDQTKLGEACRTAFGHLDMFRKTYLSQPEFDRNT